ncbi:hypothetical protein [Sinorhizobium meliloti]|uniref:Uncharacterized protein n=1 Tax=Rhizobium meliloti (strain 1021) TaxID=266834 RepID=Q92XP0_RHIME|nr:hypothetical protein [Sinorhizobium meliloti]TWA94070.1 hypothetical protein FB000_12333 [Ensifer sp. SEMIA 134]TWB30319.1 hypothetical protein FB001_12082 [Ensifer sp. SEMIA 135]AAK65862.2 hypothetical protein SMa2233 [Sinorhizobium meliloti 1021]AGG70905.1 Hypothetical protein SM2011_a2233 [Sinorhizobium meliloti 2011]ASP60982.1 hypothetical protein CDO30_22395 [Sinorhizobium meliloti]
MADFDFRKYSDDERLLLISFENGGPMTAAQVAAILKALDADYRRMTGRELVLARLELGSTWIWLADIATSAGGWIKGTAAVVKATQDLASFAKKLREGFKPKQEPVPLNQLGAFDDSVDRSITAMAKASEETHSTIRMRKTITTDAGTETIDIEVTPKEAKEARKRVKDKPKTATLAAPDVPKAIAHHDELVGTMRALPQLTGELEAVVRALVNAAIVNGGAYLVEQVAGTLEAEGRWDIASIIRQHLDGGRGFVRVDN